MSGKELGKAITDRMKYDFKPSAVQSSRFTKVQKASSLSGNQIMSLGSQMIFDLPNLGVVFNIYWATTYFRFGINIQ